MKEFLNLAFANFLLFQIIYFLVIVDAAYKVGTALIKRNFKAYRLTDYLYKLVLYTILLMAANLVEEAAKLHQEAQVIASIPVFATILAREFVGLFKRLPTETPSPTDEN